MKDAIIAVALLAFIYLPVWLLPLAHWLHKYTNRKR